MTKPMNRSNSRRKKYVRTPGGETKETYSKRKKTKKHYSAISHVRLKGVSSDSKAARSTRTPSRMYGGHLSPDELKIVLKYANRVELGMLKMDDVEIRYRKYVKQMLKE